ncbi:alanine racemase [Ruminococcaceae bacterium OttesenSCG-928-A16]|nr:alanine racemase [Ruminococcaceae bacterium OttesenSCG-928-A16]
MEMDFERRCWAEIDLDRLRKNFALIQKQAGNAVVMAVVKANAYGHGDVAAVRAMESAGARYFAVSGLAEAVRLRRAGIAQPILVLGYTSPQHAQLLALHGIQQCVFSIDYARQLSAAAAAAGVTLLTHIKVDTGMARLGFCAKDDMETALGELQEATKLPGLEPVGIFTHFAVADSIEPDDIAYTQTQFALFEEVCTRLAVGGISFRYRHSCNSAGFVTQPAMHLNLVRPGIILYGCNPSPEVQLPGLKPAFSLKTVVTMVKTLKKGDDISYGRTFTAPQDMRVATLAVGYADGYPRLLSGRGVVGIHGQPAKLLGRVCMDQVVVDITHIPNVHLGDVATVFGGGGADSVDEVAAKCGTINYEILCNIGRRVQRVYTEDGQETMLADYMEELR